MGGGTLHTGSRLLPFLYAIARTVTARFSGYLPFVLPTSALYHSYHQLPVLGAIPPACLPPACSTVSGSCCWISGWAYRFYLLPGRTCVDFWNTVLCLRFTPACLPATCGTAGSAACLQYYRCCLPMVTWNTCLPGGWVPPACSAWVLPGLLHPAALPAVSARCRYRSGWNNRLCHIGAVRCSTVSWILPPFYRSAVSWVPAVSAAFFIDSACAPYLPGGTWVPAIPPASGSPACYVHTCVLPAVYTGNACWEVILFDIFLFILPRYCSDHSFHSFLPFVHSRYTIHSVLEATWVFPSLHSGEMQISVHSFTTIRPGPTCILISISWAYCTAHFVHF